MSAPAASPTAAAGPDQALFPAMLGFLAGLVDVTSWLLLGGLFTAHITGNLVVIAANVFDGRALHAAQVVAVPVFIFFVACIGMGVRRSGIDVRRMEFLLLGLQTLLLAAGAIMAIWIMPSRAPQGWGAGLVAMLAVAAMATQNTLLHLSRAHAPTTAVMTGNIVECTLALVAMATRTGKDADYSIARAQWRATWPIAVGFLSGCVIGSLSAMLLADGTWFVATAVSAAIWAWQVRR